MVFYSAGVDVGGSSVKAWVVGDDYNVVGRAAVSTPVLKNSAHRNEFLPNHLWRAVISALSMAIAKAGPAALNIEGVTVTSLRQGFVLIGDQIELGNGVYNSDRRGAAQLELLKNKIGAERLYEVTGHWSAPELTLPKLMHIAHTEPERWAETRRVLFVHDWVVWRLTGVMRSEVSQISAGQMADVEQRDWAKDIINELGLGMERFAPSVEPGVRVGEVTAAASRSIPVLKIGTPVVSGGGDTQFAALGMGGLQSGAVTIVAGSSTPIQVATSMPIRDPQRRPWVSTHMLPTLWAAEFNAGYPGTMAAWLAGVVGDRSIDDRRRSSPGANGVTALVSTPHWAEQYWAWKAPNAIIGVTPSTTPGDLADAMLESHAFGIRGNLEDLASTSQGLPARVLLGGGAAHALGTILPDALNRPIDLVAEPMPAALAGAFLVGRALGEDPPLPDPEFRTLQPTESGRYERSYSRYLSEYSALHAAITPSAPDPSPEVEK